MAKKAEAVADTDVNSDLISSTDLATIDRPSGSALAAIPPLDDEVFAGLESAGMENVSVEDLLIPRLTILQQLSPQLNRAKPEFIEGAVPGMFIDTGRGDVFEPPLEFIVCFYAMTWLEWAPLGSGKGLVKNWGTDKAAALLGTTENDKRQHFRPNGNQVIDTATFYVLNLTAGGRRAFIPLTSTQLKAARTLLTRIEDVRIARRDGTEMRAPIFYQSWLAVPVPVTNPKGTWYGWTFAPGRRIMSLDPSGALLEEAKEFHQQSKDGLMKADVGSINEAETSDEQAPF